MTGAASVELSSRDVQRKNAAAAGRTVGAAGVLVSVTTLLRGERAQGLRGLALERVLIAREVDALEADSTLLRRRWKWWKEQNCYLQLAQSVAMGNADTHLQHDRSFRKETAHLLQAAAAISSTALAFLASADVSAFSLCL